MSGVFTIPADLCFVTTLANGLWRRVGGDPLALASMTIFLPTRRACRALREAFLRAGEAKATLLPRLRPLGDVDEIELNFADEGMLDDLPPALAPLRRQMLLTRLVLQKETRLPLDQAARLAQALGSLLDQAQIEGVDLKALATLVPEDYAAHWQETLRFLDIVTEVWPQILKEEGLMDAAARRAEVLRRQARLWEKTPPEARVIVAGSTGSVPAAAALMQTVSRLPKGEVILPALDLTLDEDAWQRLDETHPQYGMQRWLEVAGLRRAEVPLWEGFGSVRPERVRLLSEALRPAQAAQGWQDLSREAISPAAFEGLSLLACEHPREEADVIALRLRAALEEEGRTAALVTPDRALAARVGAALGRWGIAADDSAGTPLSAWPAGSFLLDILAAAAPDLSPVEALALLKHPLAACGEEPAACRRRAREVEIKVWRGVRPRGGWSGAAKLMDDPVLTAWLERLAEAFAPVTKAWREEKNLAAHIAAHVALAEFLAATDKESGAARLWQGEAGEAASAWLEEWSEAGRDFPPLTGEAYARLFRALMAQVTVRPSYGTHPRLAILGPLEARLLHHDLVILGGLNEGTWPPSAALDPWLSRPMKKNLGLPSPERRVGLSAHDFVQLACAPEVLLTRAARLGTTPTVPSRFLLQIEAVLRVLGYEAESLTPRAPWRAWAGALDAAEKVAPCGPPQPRPPLEARPSGLSVTEIATWIANPYAIYARRILKLQKLDPLDAEAAAADIGTAIHAALEHFSRAACAVWPQDPLALLLEEGARAFAPYADRPQIKAFWMPRFEKMAAWFVEEEKKRRAEGARFALVEGKGVLPLFEGALTLTGRADRIDFLADGAGEIIDYKTGSPPSKEKVKEGTEPQLALLAFLLREGAFKELGPRVATRLSYWQIKGGQEPAKKISFEKETEEMIARAFERLAALVQAFADPATPYLSVPRAALTPKYNDYEHLARIKEWGRDRGGRG